MKTLLSKTIRALSLITLSLAVLPAGAATNYTSFSTLPASQVISNADGLSYYWKSNGVYFTKRVAWQDLSAQIKSGLPRSTEYSLPQKTVSNSIVCWGDSITAGSPYPGYDIPSYCYFLGPISGMVVTNWGRGGDPSAWILNRFMTNSQYWGSPTIIWSGYNDFFMFTNGNADSSWTNGCFNNISNMVVRLTTTNFVIMGILNGTNEGIGTATYFAVTNFNGLLKRTYKNHFFDAHQWLVTHFDDTDPQDLVDVANDVTPHSLRYQQTVYPWVHLNARGSAVIARGLCTTIINSWDSNLATAGMVKQNIGLWAENSPVIQSPMVRGSLITSNIDTFSVHMSDLFPALPGLDIGFIPYSEYGNTLFYHGNFLIRSDVTNTYSPPGDFAIEDQALKGLHMIHFAFSNGVFIARLGDQPAVLLDNTALGSQQVLISTPPGYMGVLGYNRAGQIVPWQLFATNSFLYGATYIQNANMDLISPSAGAPDGPYTAHLNGSINVSSTVYAGQFGAPGFPNSQFIGSGCGLTFTNANGAKFTLVVNASTNGFIFKPQ